MGDVQLPFPYFYYPVTVSMTSLRHVVTIFLRYEQKKAVSWNCSNREEALRVQYSD